MKRKNAAVASASAPEARIEALATQAHAQTLPIVSWRDVQKLEDDVHFAEAGEALKVVAAICKQVEAERKEIVVPLNDVVKKINAKAKAITRPLDDLRQHIEADLMHPYTARKQAEALAKVEKRAAREEKKGNEQFAEDIRQHAMAMAAPPKVEGMQSRAYWSARVVDLNSFLVAFVGGDARCTAAESAIQEAVVKAMAQLARVIKDPNRAPPGVEFYEETTFVIRAG